MELDVDRVANRMPVDAEQAVPGGQAGRSGLGPAPHGGYHHTVSGRTRLRGRPCHQTFTSVRAFRSPTITGVRALSSPDEQVLARLLARGVGGVEVAHPVHEILEPRDDGEGRG